MKTTEKLLIGLALTIMWVPNVVYMLYYTQWLQSDHHMATSMRKRSVVFADGFKVYNCALMAREGMGIKTWDPKSQHDHIRAYLLKNKPPDEPYIDEMQGSSEYTPQYVTLMIPLTYLYFHQILLFILFPLSFALVIGTSLLLGRRSIGGNSSHWIGFFAVLFATGPAWFNFFMAQTGAVMGGLLGIFLMAWLRKGRGSALVAGTTMAIMGILKPHHLVVPLIMCLAARRWSTLCILAAALAILTIPAALIMGIDTLLQYPAALWHILHSYDTTLNRIMNQNATVSLQSPFYYAVGAPATRFIMPIVTIFGGIYVYRLWRKVLAKADATIDQGIAPIYAHAWAASLIISLICSTHGQIYDLMQISTAWAMTLPVLAPSRIAALPSRLDRWWAILFITFPFFTWATLLCNTVYTGMIWLPVFSAMGVIATLQTNKMLHDKGAA